MTEHRNIHRRSAGKRTNGTVGVVLTVVAAGMLGLAFASEPLYRTFCQVTGYGGTTQKAEKVPEEVVSANLITVKFDANVNRELPWRFHPLQREVTVHPGEETLAFYEATNMSDKPIVGSAVFNVSPFKAGSYFSKIACFCFTEQVLKPGETVQMPVSFFVDPEMTADPNTADVTTITLSYTFYPAEDQKAAQDLHVQVTPAIDRTSKPALRAPGGGNG